MKKKRRDSGATIPELMALFEGQRYQPKPDPVRVEEMIRARRLWLDLSDVFAVSHHNFDEAYKMLVEVLERYGFENTKTD